MAKLKEVKERPGDYIYHCPGCDHKHIVSTITRNSVGALWKFNGDINKPTLSPSLNGITKNDQGIIVWQCHHYIENGMIRYLNDCTHPLKGQTVELPEV